MPKKGKGKAKNTVHKAKHSKLMGQKISKVKLEKQLQKERLKALIKKVNAQKEQDTKD
jgi:5,10-methylene-tetrahydrofolate dehydrogenase/methenyl tetrahydrofolate cyclohydrolase